MSVLRVLSPGLYSTIQDLGRYGAQHLGVPVSGALDSVNLRLANLLVGNAETSGALEIVIHGPALEVQAASARFALAGPGARIELLNGGGRGGVAAYESFRLERGDRFQIAPGKESAVCYLAVEGGYATPSIMGSQSTFVRGGLGGFHGRTLQAGDEIPLRRGEASARPERALPKPGLSAPASVRIMLGPQDDYFDRETIDAFLGARFTVSHQSDRMGLRLSGFKLRHAKDFNIVSDGIAPGAIQVPGSGEPIILMADRQTTGGYPKIGVVISADLPGLGRLRPGEAISFKSVSFDEAREAARNLDEWFLKTKQKIHEIAAQTIVDINALREQNLIGGVVNAKVPLVD